LIIFDEKIRRVNTMKFKKLSRDEEKNTKIMAGHVSFSVEQLEKEITDNNSDIGKKLRSIEVELENY
jgi:putative AlgH/UPF0301 family transcriptional regulator